MEEESNNEEREKKLTGIVKKPKVVPKLLTPTIPQPFSLSTDKRIKSKLSKSLSVNSKADTQNLIGTRNKGNPKSTTFRASPLPSFYHRKDPPIKPEVKKVPVTRARSPKLGKRSNSVADARYNNEEDKNRSSSRMFSGTAKEGIQKLVLKGAMKAPSAQEKKGVKNTISVPSGSRIRMNTV